MDSTALAEAVSEAKRFLERANTLRNIAKTDKDVLWGGSPATSAVRRASMDLTRALAKLRRP